MNQIAIDFEQARANRDAAVAQADSNAADEWKAAALAALKRTCQLHASFLVDEVWTDNPALSRPREPRAMGAIMRRAVAAGWCVADGFAPTRQAHAHAGLRRSWRSLIFTPQAAPCGVCGADNCDLT